MCKIINLITDEGQTFGYYLKLIKCKYLIGKCYSLSEAIRRKDHLLQLDFIDECVIIHPDNFCDTGHLFGVECVGSFIGSDEYVTSFLNLKLDSLRNKLKDISLIEDKQVLHQIFRLSFSGMVAHLQRTTPSSLLLGFLSEYDLLKKQLCFLVIGSHPSCSTWIQACLNLADGGLSYHDEIRSGYTAYVVAIFQSPAPLCRIDPQIFECRNPSNLCF